MDSDDKNLNSYTNKNNLIRLSNDNQYSIQKAIIEFDELKNIALNCFDKNGNPNIAAALRAAENKAKIAGLYKQATNQVQTVFNMGEINIDGEQLKLKIGEDCFIDENNMS